MLDKKLLLNNLEYVQKKFIEKKYKDFDFNLFYTLEEKRKNLQEKVEEANQTRNQITKKIASPDTNQEDKEKLKEKIRKINEENTLNKKELEKVLEEVNEVLLTIPNLHEDGIPIGLNEEDNIVIRTIGEPKKFNFQVKEHNEIGEKLEGLDFKAGVDLAKSRFVVMKGDIAKIHRALAQFMLEIQTRNGYVEHNVPQIVNRKALIGTGQLPKFEEDLFCVGEDLFLIPTAEVPLTNMVANKILKEEDLPIKMVAHTNCYRKEAGSHGKDVKGMIRQHQFEKVELVQITTPEKSEEALNEILNNAEEILQLLELPYRVVQLCSGDLGFSAKKTYDIEVWIPSQNKYREISSCSNTGDFQARRMNAKYKDKNNNKNFVHTLNGSALAVGRTLVALLENYQKEDGTIIIPKALEKYFKEEN